MTEPMVTAPLLRTRIQRAVNAITQGLADGSVAVAHLRLLEDGGGVDFSSVDRDTFLRELPTSTIALLLEHLPTLAGPWKTTDMTAGEPTRRVRPGHGSEPIAEVTIDARSKLWCARIGDTFLEGHWATIEPAMAACDEHLTREGVVFWEGY